MITIKEKINKPQNSIKNFCSSKNTIKRVKRQAIEWKKVFATYITDKGPDCMKNYKSVRRRQMIQFFSVGKRFEKTFNKRRNLNAQ